MAWLTDSVVLRHPDGGEPVALLAGSVLPEWADGLVGGHVLTDTNPAGDTADQVEVDRDARIAELEAQVADLQAQLAAGKQDTEPEPEPEPEPDKPAPKPEPEPDKPAPKPARRGQPAA